MSYRMLAIMGTFRTGSTFLARALSAHRNISVISDSTFNFFKAFRNEIFLREEMINFDLNYPISDNFFSQYVEIDNLIKKSDFHIPIKHIPIETTLANINRLTIHHSPIMCPFISEIQVDNYKDLFLALLDAAKKAYGDSDTTLMGFKDTFVEQFIAPLTNTFPDVKCIYLIRDPRAVLASQNAYFKKHKTARGRYPLLYVTRHWRKSIAYALDNINQNNNILFIRYEDLTKDPELFFHKICSYLNLSFDPRMLDGSKYKDGSGAAWSQNSAYGTSKTINTQSHDKWKSILSMEEIQLVEELCSPEMESLGYERITKQDSVYIMNSKYKENRTEIDSWLLEYIDQFELDNINELNKEIVRNYCLNKLDGGAGLEYDIAQKIFIYKDLYKALPLLKKQLNSL